MSTTATRLITLIMLLQGKPNQKASDLAATLGVSVRTLHRYFGMLEEMGIPVTSERGPAGGFSLVQGYRMPPMLFTPEEAVAIYLGSSLVGQLWGQLYQEPALGAMAKLDAVLPADQRREIEWARRSLVVTDLHHSNLREATPLLEQLRTAARRQQRVLLCYHSSNAASETTREVDPYTLVYRSGWWYLAGYCHLRGELRIFRVDRIQSLEVLPTGFEKPQDFDIHVFLADSLRQEPGIPVRLRLLPQAVHLQPQNLPGVVSILPQEDGSQEITLQTQDLHWLASLVLSFGSWLVVEEPPALQELVQTWAQAICNQYD